MHIDKQEYEINPPKNIIMIYLFKIGKHPFFHSHDRYEIMHVFLIMELSRAYTNLLARGSTYEPIPLVVLLHGLSRSSSKLLARTRPRIPVFPTMNSLAHSILKFEHEMNFVAHSSQTKVPLVN